MNEMNLLQELSPLRIFDNNTGECEQLLQQFAKLNSTSELATKVAASPAEIFLTPAETLDDFLKEKFSGIGIAEFMQIYTRMHVGEAFCLPVVTPTVTCLFGSFDVSDLLSQMLVDYQSILKQNAFGSTFLNLHTDATYKFTLLHVTNLTESKNKFYSGYHHETEHFHFFLKSSAQFDLTILYEEL